MKLFVWGPAPNPRRVKIYLAEKGLSVPMEEVGGERGKLSETFKARYAQAMVPMLELDDGTQIGEAMAICRYFESLHPTPALMGTDARSKAVIEMWERRAYDEGMIGAAEVFRNTHPLFADRSIPGHSQAMTQLAVLVERGHKRVRHFSEMFDRQLENNEFVTGDHITVADITALCVVDFARALARIPLPSDCPNLQRWYDIISARPSAKL